uniref:Uncharacterized protein n=1 Tax=Anguilla anguilla TaxID=7936 RepID=A0A0E9T2S1_ANGAN
MVLCSPAGQLSPPTELSITSSLSLFSIWLLVMSIFDSPSPPCPILDLNWHAQKPFL